MRAYPTFLDMRTFKESITTRAAMLFKSASTSAGGKNLFLSHSSKDTEHLDGAMELLRKHGASVYVDCGDDRLPDEPSPKTAEILRSTIKKLRRFVVLVTANTRDSWWIPWELGLADAAMHPQSVALLALSEQEESSLLWAEREYLGLYRRIIWSNLKGHTTPLWIVYDHVTNSGTPLADWVQSG